MNKSICYFLTCLVSTTLLAQDAPPVNPDAILKELKDMKNKQESTRKTQLTRTYQEINTASASGATALDLYLQIIRNTQFNGQNRENMEFRDWKKKKEENLKSKSFQECLRLHLVYLALTLQRASGVDVNTLLPGLIAYVSEVQAEGAYLEDGMDLLKPPLSGSIFARWYGISDLLGGAANWELSPSNVDSMWEKTILPAYREARNPHAIDYWNQKIDNEANAAAQTKRTFDAETFAQVRKPQLLWKRAEEFNRIGLKNRAASEMLAVIKAYPANHDAPAWTTELETLLGGK